MNLKYFNETKLYCKFRWQTGFLIFCTKILHRNWNDFTFLTSTSNDSSNLIDECNLYNCIYCSLSLNASTFFSRLGNLINTRLTCVKLKTWIAFYSTETNQYNSGWPENISKIAFGRFTQIESYQRRKCAAVKRINWLYWFISSNKANRFYAKCSQSIFSVELKRHIASLHTIATHSIDRIHIEMCVCYLSNALYIVIIGMPQVNWIPISLSIVQYIF